MSKITIALLAVAAFLYAAWVVFLRKPLPDSKGATGLRRRFILAVFLFAGLLGASVSAKDRESAPVLCYAPMPPNQEEARRMSRGEVVAAIKGIWLTLDHQNGEGFRRKLDAAAESGAIRHKVAGMLEVAFRDLSFHKARTRGAGARVTCYDMTTLGGTLMTSRERALKQLELLDEARKNGTIDEETAKKAEVALSREIEFLQRANELDRSGDWQDGDKLAKEYEEERMAPGADATEAASIIVEMEGGRLPAPNTGEEK